ncbi:MAG: hypothetical protein ACLPV4_12805 [Solirubrobacteraceae bacterium]
MTKRSRPPRRIVRIAAVRMSAEQLERLVARGQAIAEQSVELTRDLDELLGAIGSTPTPEQLERLKRLTERADALIAEADRVGQYLAPALEAAR